MENPESQLLHCLFGNCFCYPFWLTLAIVLELSLFNNKKAEFSGVVVSFKHNIN